MSTHPHLLASKPTPPAATSLDWAWLTLYFCAFVLLGRVSFIRPFEGLNITPWNPEPALAIALLMVRWRAWPWVALSLLAVDSWLRNWTLPPVSAWLAAALLTASYCAAAWAIKPWLAQFSKAASASDVGWMILLCAASAALSGLCFVSVSAAAAGFSWAVAAQALGLYWVGDFVGLVVTLPMVWAVVSRQGRRAISATLGLGQWWALAGLGLCLLLAVFHGYDAAQTHKPEYAFLLLLPVMGAAMRMGLAGGASLAALTQLGLIVAMLMAGVAKQPVIELQVLMATVGITGLLLGSAVDERERAQQALQRNSKLAAAGEWSAALAHELSQPLTALATYAQAMRLLLPAQADDHWDAARHAKAQEVSQRMDADARRAGEIVRRLRDFFKGGALNLAPCDLRALASETLADHLARAKGLHIELQLQPGAEQLPKPLVDRIQLGVVLRNLVANAIEAVGDSQVPQVPHGSQAPPAQNAANASPEPRFVSLRCHLADDKLLIEVHDSGPGVPEGLQERIFQSGQSGKATGMGIGLGISRAIVQAHGGELWAQPGPGGHFFISLPLEGAEPVFSPSP